MTFPISAPGSSTNFPTSAFFSFSVALKRNIITDCISCKIRYKTLYNSCCIQVSFQTYKLPYWTPNLSLHNFPLLKALQNKINKINSRVFNYVVFKSGPGLKGPTKLSNLFHRRKQLLVKILYLSVLNLNMINKFSQLKRAIFASLSGSQTHFRKSKYI